MPSLLNTVSNSPRVDQLLSRCNFSAPPAHVDCAVSGGADSVALLVLACALGLQVTAWHVDHGLRDNSHTEATFVRDLAAQLSAHF